jgi:hypothetical protein
MYPRVPELASFVLIVFGGWWVRPSCKLKAFSFEMM